MRPAGVTILSWRASVSSCAVWTGSVDRGSAFGRPAGVCGRGQPQARPNKGNSMGAVDADLPAPVLCALRRCVLCGDA
eukprot:363862-Chlamydomonas_euryale.AAC.18